MVDELKPQEDQIPVALMSRKELMSKISQSGNTDNPTDQKGDPQKDENPNVDPNADGKDQTDKPSEVEVLKDQVEKLTKRLDDKGSFVGRQSEEIREMRMLASQNTGKTQAQLKEEFNAKYQEDPQAAVQEELDRRDAERQLQYLDSQKQSMKTKAFVEEKFPNFSKDISDIAQIALDTGYPEEAVNRFKLNPFAEEAGLLLNLAKSHQLIQEKKNLETQLNEIKGRSAQEASKVDEVSRLSNTVKAGSGKTSPVKDWSHVTKENMRHLPVDELREFVKAKMNTRVSY